MAGEVSTLSSRQVPGTIGLCLGLVLLMLLGSMIKQGALLPTSSVPNDEQVNGVDLRSMSAELGVDAFVKADNDYFLNEPIASITDRVATGVRDALAKTGKKDRFATRLHASWDRAIREIARSTTNPDDLRFALRPYFAAWMDDYIWLVRHAKNLGFSFENLDDLEALERSQTEQLLFLRYDIHLRDVAPFYGILDANRTLGIPSVAYLHWGYSDVEDAAAADFLALRKFQSPSTRFGLHLSPIPTVLSRTKGGYKVYVAWLKRDGLAELADAFGGIDDWTSPVLHRRLRSVVDATIQDFRSRFSDFQSISLHGSEFDNAVRRNCAKRSAPCGLTTLLAADLFSSNAFAELRDNIIDRVVDDYGLETATDSTAAQTVVCSLQRAAADKRSLVILLHPAQFMRGRRPYRDLSVTSDGLIDCSGSS